MPMLMLMMAIVMTIIKRMMMMMMIQRLGNGADVDVDDGEKYVDSATSTW